MECTSKYQIKVKMSIVERMTIIIEGEAKNEL
jgi:hypothetical protein